MKNLNIDMEQITSMVEDFIQLSEKDQQEIRGQIFYKRLLKDARVHYKTEQEAKENIIKTIEMATEISKFSDKQKSELSKMMKDEGIDFDFERG